MALKIRPVRQMAEDNGIKTLVHGPAGAGKTVLSCTAGEPTLIISAEAGLLSVRNAPKYVHGVEVDTIDDLEEIYDFLKEEEEIPISERQYQTIGLDSITEIAERILAKEKRDAKDPRQAYGVMQDDVLDLLRRFRDLRGYNVIMTCKQRRIPQDNGPSLLAPMMPGQNLHQQIPYLFDEVFALRVEEDEDGEVYRVLQTSRDAQYEAKDRSGMLDMFEEPNLKAIFEKIAGESTKKKKTKVKAEKSEPEVEEDEQDVGSTSEEQDAEEVEEAEFEEVEEVEEEDDADEVEVATSLMYWVHHESESFGLVKKGEEVPQDPGIEFVDRKTYNKFKEEYSGE